MKYLVLICRGHLPVAGSGDLMYRVNKDIKPFQLLVTPQTLSTAACFRDFPTAKRRSAPHQAVS
jgi:hypothetical protein